MSDLGCANRMPVTESMRGRLGSRNVAVVDQLSAGHNHTAVPLMGHERFEQLFGDGNKQFLLDGLVACTITTTPEGFGLHTLVVPGQGLDVRSFLELTTDLVRPLVPDEMTLPPEAVGGVVDSGTLAISGVGLWVNRTDPTEGFGMLYVPNSFRELPQPHPEYTPEEYTTNLAAGVFYTAASASLAQVTLPGAA